ncbi:hypothetical protein SK128_016805 [Halocaridina rubra]|uniref:BZIP domain-containing protein n=1 Tax=Halocaridina rubra TaxID=373956 RepID=A0AAN8X315_HALRR
MNDWGEDVVMIHRNDLEVMEKHELASSFQQSETSTMCQENSFLEDEDDTCQELLEMFPSELALNWSDDIPLASISAVSSGESTNAPPKKKRGRRPNSERGLPLARQRKPPRQKMYKIDQPFKDRELEIKRKSAINAKRHRDMQKDYMRDLDNQLNAMKSEIVVLGKERETRQLKVSEISEQLAAIKDYMVKQAASNVLLLEDA